MIKWFTIALFTTYILLLLSTLTANADVNWASKSNKITVMIIDSGVLETHSLFKNKNIKCLDRSDCTDTNGHGTAMTSLVIYGELNKNFQPDEQICDNVQIYICNYFATNINKDIKYSSCLESAVKMKVDFVNFSSTASFYDTHEHYAILRMSENGTKFITAMGNEGADVKESNTYPALLSTLKGLEETVIPVSATTREGSKWDMSNYGIPSKKELGVNVRSASNTGAYLIGSGTSMSTAIYTHKLLMKECAK